MNLYKNEDIIVINKDEKCLNIKVDKDGINIWVLNTSDKNENRTSKQIRKDNSFRITEYDRKLFYIFNEFYNGLVSEYNFYKDFNDTIYGENTVYREKNNCFTFFLENNSLMRVLKGTIKESDEKAIVLSFENLERNQNKGFSLPMHNSGYTEFIEYFKILYKELNKEYKENWQNKKYTKKIGESYNG